MKMHVHSMIGKKELCYSEYMDWWKDVWHMAKSVVLAEKPSVARDIANVLKWYGNTFGQLL